MAAVHRAYGLKVLRIAKSSIGLKGGQAVVLRRLATRAFLALQRRNQGRHAAVVCW